MSAFCVKILKSVSSLKFILFLHDEFLTQVVNIGIPKHILGFCFHVSKRGYKIGYELTREENLLEAANALTSYRGMAGAGRSIKKLARVSID